ncbi:hypothetical protein FFLO_01352 [Filobasidium floriforme]|uniref:Uncharacterized protein n=1 Tax=Filobasidium floriforme TaxID=5210 RepID=A0A8K0JQD9_9TREE|nr:hypothetical protein FFLO_01352 [Filobasidium floriforme]
MFNLATSHRFCLPSHDLTKSLAQRTENCVYSSCDAFADLTVPLKGLRGPFKESKGPFKGSIQLSKDLLRPSCDTIAEDIEGQETKPVIRSVSFKNGDGDEYIGTATYTHVHPQADQKGLWDRWTLLEKACIEFTLDSARLAQGDRRRGSLRPELFKRLSEDREYDFANWYSSKSMGHPLHVPVRLFEVSDKETKDREEPFVECRAIFWFTHNRFERTLSLLASEIENCTKLDYICRFGKDGKPFAFVGDKEEQAASSMSFNQAPEDELSFTNFSFSYFSNEGTDLQTHGGSGLSTNFGG